MLRLEKWETFRRLLEELIKCFFEISQLHIYILIKLNIYNQTRPLLLNIVFGISSLEHLSNKLF